MIINNRCLYQRIVFPFLCMLISFSGYAQQSLWVGQTVECDASSAMVGLISDVSWSLNGGYISLSGSGYYRKVTATQYWSGTVTLKCTWRYRLYSNGSQQTTSKTWTFTCKDNPVSIKPERLTLHVGESYVLNYSHRTSNEYTSYADVYFASTSSNISVEKNGKITALSPGTAYVNVYSKISNDSD